MCILMWPLRRLKLQFVVIEKWVLLRVSITIAIMYGNMRQDLISRSRLTFRTKKYCVRVPFDLLEAFVLNFYRLFSIQTLSPLIRRLHCWAWLYSLIHHILCNVRYHMANSFVPCLTFGEGFRN